MKIFSNLLAIGTALLLCLCTASGAFAEEGYGSAEKAQEKAKQQAQSQAEQAQQQRAAQVERARMKVEELKQHDINLSQDELKQLQEKLNQQVNANLEIDGIWNEKTKEAVAKFQKQNNLTESGIPTKETLAQLGIKADFVSGTTVTQPQQ